MSLLKAYNVIKEIRRDQELVLLRAERCTDRQKVLLKVVQNNQSNSPEINLLANEFHVADRFDFDRIPRYLELETVGSHSVAVLQNVEGVLFENYITEGRLTVVDTLTIGISICEILEQFFLRRIIHRNLCPDSFLIEPESLSTTVIDFTVACELSQIAEASEEMSYRNEFIPYMSPEQTGRINGRVDFRSDLYSLGVILYRMLTGKFPFTETDPLALIHSHIARVPVAPSSVQPDVPEVLSEIVLKLLSKNPGDRYQSSFGLKTDLQVCLEEFRQTGAIDIIVNHHQYCSGELNEPKGFYGRGEEKDQLIRLFGESKQGKVNIALVQGHSGVGKSALVNHALSRMLLSGGIVVNGKFNEFQRNIPYNGFIQAFTNFTDFILTQSAEVKKIWKERILNAVGENGSVLTQIIPQLDLILDWQPEVPELPPNETKNRFHYVFLRFIRCIAQREHPLIIFFDDVQWADAASLNLLKVIFDVSDLEALLFIGAYRDDEISTSSLISDTIAHLKGLEIVVNDIPLRPLPFEHLEAIVHEMLAADVNDPGHLLHLVHDRSGGNPFYIVAFLKSLYSRNMLTFDISALKWRYNSSQAEVEYMTSDLAELIIRSIQHLPAGSLDALKLAACLGSHFDLDVFAIAIGKAKHDAAKMLQPAVEENLLSIHGDSCRFSHDHIHEAAYSLLTSEDKELTHLRIGRSLHNNFDQQGRERYVFEIVNQFNAGRTHVIGPEKLMLAELNLYAGVKAKASSAYRHSVDYLQTGILLLPGNCWEANYNLTLQLFTEGAESCFLTGNLQQMETWIDIILGNSIDVLDQVRAYEIRIKNFIAENKLAEAVKTAIKMLELLGTGFPKRPGKLHVLLALLDIRRQFGQNNLDRLLKLPLIKDKKAEAAIRLLVTVGSAVYFGRPDLLPLFVCKAFSLMIRHGNSAFSGTVCTSFGMIIIAGLGNLPLGYKLGQTALALSEKYEVSSLKCQSRLMYYSLVAYLNDRLQDTVAPLLDNYWYGLENGNTEFASYSAFCGCSTSFFCGHHLNQVTEESLKFHERLLHLKNETGFVLHKIFTQAVLGLHKTTEQRTILTGEIHEEEQMPMLYSEHEMAYGVFYIYKLMLAYHFGRFEEAEGYASQAQTRLNSMPGNVHVIFFYFYDSLNKLSLISEQPGQGKENILRKVSANLRIIKNFSRQSPANFLHQVLLIQAEINRFHGKVHKAVVLYEQAIDEARKNGFVNHEALAYELTGRFYLSQGKQFIAEQYLVKSYQLYTQWGATSIVVYLQRKYDFINRHPLIFDSNQLSGGSEKGKLPDVVENSTSQRLDLYSIMKAATAISAEVNLDNLLKKLLAIAIENAGAERGCLILKKESGFFIEARGFFDHEQQFVLESIPLPGNRLVSESIIQFVNATKQILVLGDAVNHSYFSLSPVIRENNTRSILCAPLVNQGDVAGFLYLENNLITDAFSPERVELLKVLSGQIVISIQNALNERKKQRDFEERESLLRQIHMHQQELFKAKLEIQEQTYDNISEEIHDNIGQALTLVKININNIDLKNASVAAENLNQSKALLTKVIQDLRDIAKTLSTDFIEKVGFPEAIGQQLQYLENSRLYATSLTINGEVVRYDPQRELILFRVIQELLNNIVKHSGATAIHVEIDYHREDLVVRIIDNGKGFEIEEGGVGGRDSLGLRNIFKRIKLIDGDISFKKTGAAGTEVTVSLPGNSRLSYDS